MDDREQAVADAKDMADQLAVFATDHGWKMQAPVKANKKYSFVTLMREYQQEDGDLVQEELRAFYAINENADSDQVTHTGPDGTTTVLDPEDGSVREAVTRVHPKPRPGPEPVGTIESGLLYVEDENGERVPPIVPPTQQVADAVPPTETSVPPIGSTDAAHPVDADQASVDTHAAYESVDGVDGDAAHPDSSRDVPPTGDTVVESFKIVPPADPAEVASESLQHVAQAEKFGNDVYSQQELYGAVRHQQVAPFKNWSPVASDLTSDELLTKLGVNRKANNRLDITWVNSLSNTLDRAVVDASAEKWPPHITPKDFDPKAYGEDLRILHFLEVNGGFRSVAVARIRKIG